MPREGHPFAPDLDITGPRSVHQLIDTAISVGGSRRLRSWLLDPVTEPEAVGERQATLREMLPLTGFRSRLALTGAWVSSRPTERWDGEKLLTWLEKRRPTKSLGPHLHLLIGLAAVNIALFTLSLLARLPAWWIFSLVGYGFIYTGKYRELSETFSQAQHLSVALDRFRAVLTHLETYRYPKGGRLANLCEPFWGAHQRPSRFLRRIAAIASAASMQNNPFVWFLLNAAVPWDLYFAYRLQQYKQEMQELLPAWVDRWYELEALNSLANFAYLNPDYIFPEVRSTTQPGEETVFAAENLGHPLIPDDAKVTNDFRIGNLGEVVLITGSNMSGKSTFLRTLGVNLCLAYAGAPVDATSLRTIPMRLFTCLNVSDSLSDGISYFYAEVRRLKDLLEELEREHSFPLFFLIDEIFRGTNNRERRIGSRAYVKALVGKHGLGLISTHDLELVRLADEFPEISNYHFREEVKEGRMVFDYCLRRGPSPTTNALRIMALEGLPVEPEENW